MSKQESNTGVGFVGMLFLLFIGLKLAKIIDWSWFWICSPVIFYGCFCIIMIFFYVYCDYAASRKRNKRRL